MAPPPVQPSRDLTRKGEAVRKAILEAGTDLFAMQGIAATSITDIASKAAVNRAMISYYFGNKGGLYDAIIDEAVMAVTQSLEDALADSADDDPMRDLVMTLARILQERPHFSRMIIQEYFAPGRLFETETATKLSGFAKLTEATLLTSRLSPAAQKYDPQVIHLIIVGSLVYFILTEPFRRQMQGKVDRIITQPSTEEFARTLGEILSRGLANDAGG